jgi:hypothetical protein
LTHRYVVAPQGEITMTPARLPFLVFMLAFLPFSQTCTADEEETPPDQPARVAKNLFHAPVRLSAVDGVLDSGPSWGHSSPWVVDIDEDGVNDLIVGDFSGLFRFYRNEGSNLKPRYAKGVNLNAGGVDAKVPIY